MFGAKIIDVPHQSDAHDGGDTEVFLGHAEIKHRVPAAHGRGHDAIGHQQKRSEHGQDPALLTGGGIDPAAVGKMTADDDVIVTDQPGERAYREDDRKGREMGGQKRKADDVGLAGSPVAIKQGRCTSPTQVSRPMCAYFHFAILQKGKWQPSHLPIMFAPARLAVGLEPLSVPDAGHRWPQSTPTRGGALVPPLIALRAIIRQTKTSGPDSMPVSYTHLTLP